MSDLNKKFPNEDKKTKSNSKEEDLITKDLDTAESNGNCKESLSLENTLWANTVLASGGYILGMVTYTGFETRANMNSKVV